SAPTPLLLSVWRNSRNSPFGTSWQRNPSNWCLTPSISNSRCTSRICRSDRSPPAQGWLSSFRITTAIWSIIMADVPPPQMLWGLITGHTIARCIHVIAEAGVADALDERPTAASELAARTGLSADALARMLRLLAAHGVFASGSSGYAHTDVSRLLR